ncbi:MAG: hypothetical protein QM757_11235 [Paludibaculum sp.]
MRVGVVAAEQLEAQVRGSPPPPANDVFVAGRHPGAEVQGVRVVQTHLGERPGARLQDGVIAVVVERQVDAAGDAAGQVLQSLQQVGLGLDVGCGRHQGFGLGDRVEQGLGKHRTPVVFQYSTVTVDS